MACWQRQHSSTHLHVHHLYGPALLYTVLSVFFSTQTPVQKRQTDLNIVRFCIWRKCDAVGWQMIHDPGVPFPMYTTQGSLFLCTPPRGAFSYVHHQGVLFPMYTGLASSESLWYIESAIFYLSEKKTATAFYSVYIIDSIIQWLPQAKEYIFGCIIYMVRWLTLLAYHSECPTHKTHPRIHLIFKGTCQRLTL